MFSVRCGTRELATALIINAPCLMMPACSYAEPTMYPVVFCRNSSGVAEALASWMNWAAFCASAEKSTPCALASTPTGYPCSSPQPVTSAVP